MGSQTRWQQLFADLHAQWDEAEAVAERAEVASRTRAEFGGVGLADRLGGSLGSPVVLRCRGAGQVTGVLTEVGAGWALLDDERGGELLVSLAAVQTASGLGRQTALPPGPVRARLDLRWALRALVRDRSAVRLVLDDGAALTGTIDRVGADHLDLAEHPLDQPRRAAAVRRVHAVSLGAITVVRTAIPGIG